MVPRPDGSPGSLPPGLRILVVDDDEFITDMLPRKLRRAYPLMPPLEIITASTPEAGLRMAAERAPDVVLSDFNLRAEMDGLELLARVASSRPEAVRILMSAHTRSEIGPALARAEIHGMIEKPMRLDEIIDPIARVIMRHLREGGGAAG